LCANDVKAFMTALIRIDAHVATGVRCPEHAQYFADAQVAHDQVLWTHVPTRCNSAVGVLAERSLHAFVTASASWKGLHRRSEPK
jgi:hypothetical protein